jgi:hypothetical protein
MLRIAGPAALSGLLCISSAGCGEARETFDDHTRADLAGAGSFDAWSKERVGGQVVKFHLIPFADPQARHIEYLDGRFYDVHDEWYWFRLLNGQEIEGDSSFEPHEGGFETIDEIYAWAFGLTPPLPLDLQWSGERLYSPRFYELTRDGDDAPKLIAPGGLVYFPPREEPTPRDALWLFEIPFAEEPTHEELVLYFQHVQSSVPTQVAPQLAWVSRSAAHVDLVKTMRQEQLSYHDRTILYSDLSFPEQAVVHNGGVTAGRVHRFATRDSVVTTSADSIVVLGEAQDELPGARAVITAFDQSADHPLAVAAAASGTINLSLDDALLDPNLEQFSRVWGHAILRADAPTGMQVAPISTADFSEWKQLGMPEEFLLDRLADYSTL